MADPFERTEQLLNQLLEMWRERQTILSSIKEVAMREMEKSTRLRAPRWLQQLRVRRATFKRHRCGIYLSSSPAASMAASATAEYFVVACKEDSTETTTDEAVVPDAQPHLGAAPDAYLDQDTSAKLDSTPLDIDIKGEGRTVALTSEEVLVVVQCKALLDIDIKGGGYTSLGADHLVVHDSGINPDMIPDVQIHQDLVPPPSTTEAILVAVPEAQHHLVGTDKSWIAPYLAHSMGLIPVAVLFRAEHTIALAARVTNNTVVRKVFDGMATPCDGAITLSASGAYLCQWQQQIFDIEDSFTIPAIYYPPHDDQLMPDLLENQMDFVLADQQVFEKMFQGQFASTICKLRWDVCFKFRHGNWIWKPPWPLHPRQHMYLILECELLDAMCPPYVIRRYMPWDRGGCWTLICYSTIIIVVPVELVNYWYDELRSALVTLIGHSIFLVPAQMERAQSLLYGIVISNMRAALVCCHNSWELLVISAQLKYEGTVLTMNLTIGLCVDYSSGVAAIIVLTAVLVLPLLCSVLTAVLVLNEFTFAGCLSTYAAICSLKFLDSEGDLSAFWQLCIISVILTTHADVSVITESNTNTALVEVRAYQDCELITPPPVHSIGQLCNEHVHDHVNHKVIEFWTNNTNSLGPNCDHQLGICFLSQGGTWFTLSFLLAEYSAHRFLLPPSQKHFSYVITERTTAHGWIRKKLLKFVAANENSPRNSVFWSIIFMRLNLPWLSYECNQGTALLIFTCALSLSSSQLVLDADILSKSSKYNDEKTFVLIDLEVVSPADHGLDFPMTEYNGSAGNILHEKKLCILYFLRCVQNGLLLITTKHTSFSHECPDWPTKSFASWFLELFKKSLEQQVRRMTLILSAARWNFLLLKSLWLDFFCQSKHEETSLMQMPFVDIQSIVQLSDSWVFAWIASIPAVFVLKWNRWLLVARSWVLAEVIGNVIVDILMEESVYRKQDFLVLILQQAIEHWNSYCDSMMLLYKAKLILKLKQEDFRRETNMHASSP